MLIDSVKKLKTFASDFAAGLSAPVVVKLHGDLGAGKTEFCRAVIHHLCGENTIVQSPTFNMVNLYDSAKGRIAHFDLYRLADASELAELNLDEYISDSIVLIEWPDLAAEILPKNAINVKIEITDDGARKIEIS